MILRSRRLGRMVYRMQEIRRMRLLCRRNCPSVRVKASLWVRFLSLHVIFLWKEWGNSCWFFWIFVFLSFNFGLLISGDSAIDGEKGKIDSVEKRELKSPFPCGRLLSQCSLVGFCISFIVPFFFFSYLMCSTLLKLANVQVPNFILLDNRFLQV